MFRNGPKRVQKCYLRPKTVILLVLDARWEIGLSRNFRITTPQGVVYEYRIEASTAQCDVCRNHPLNDHIAQCKRCTGYTGSEASPLLSQ